MYQIVSIFICILYFIDINTEIKVVVFPISVWLFTLIDRFWFDLEFGKQFDKFVLAIVERQTVWISEL